MKNDKDFDIVFMKPIKFEECKQCVEYIVDDKIVFINLVGVDRESSQRILDYIAGAAYIKNSKMEIPTDNVLCIIPENKKYHLAYSRKNKNFGNYENETEEILPDHY